MKLTWFGGTTLRVYVGGEIVVIDAGGAADGIDHGELVAGANHLVALGKFPRSTQPSGGIARPPEPRKRHHRSKSTGSGRPRC